jgi:hypothetical protein
LFGLEGSWYKRIAGFATEGFWEWGEKDLKRTICLMLYEKKWYDKFCK